jgi:hypothetical protein
MTDRAMSESAMLASLRDITLPDLTTAAIAADVAVTVGLAALAALLVAGLLRLVSLRRRPARLNGIEQTLARLRAEPEGARRVALLHMLRAQAPERYAELRGALYRPDGGIDTDALEAEVARRV